MAIRLFNQRFSPGEIRRLGPSFLRPAIRPLKALNFAGVWLSQRLHRTRAWGFPPFIMIEPTSRCDMSCPMCFVRDNKDSYPLGEMSFAHYRRILDEMGPRLITLALWGYGEPLLNRSLPEMISYARRKGIFTAVTTNGLSLDEEKADSLIDSALDYLIFSVDGASEETYALYRSRGKFATVTDNIARLARRKRERRSVRPFVNLQFIVMRGNEHEIPRIRELARELRVDKLSLKKAWVFTKEEEERIVPRDPRYRLSIYSGVLDTSPCSRPWNTPFITWKGDVLVCCADFSYAHVMGNVFEEGGFGKVWNNDGFRAFRKAILEDITRIDICRRCGAKNFADGFTP